MSIEQYLELYLTDREEFENLVKQGEITEEDIEKLKKLYNKTNIKDEVKNKDDNKNKESKDTSGKNKKSKKKSKSSKTKKTKTKSKTNRNNKNKEDGIIKSSIKFFIKLLITIITISALAIAGYYFYMKYNSEEGTASNNIEVNSREENILEDGQSYELYENTYYTVGESASSMSSGLEENVTFDVEGEYEVGIDLNQGLYSITLSGESFLINGDEISNSVNNIYLEDGDILTIENGNSVSLSSNITDDLLIEEGLYYFTSNVTVDGKEISPNESLELNNGDLILTSEATTMVNQVEVTETISTTDYDEICYVDDVQTDCSNLISYNEEETKVTNSDQITEQVTYINDDNIICSQNNLSVDCSILYSYNELVIDAKNDLDEKREIVNILEASFN